MDRSVADVLAIFRRYRVGPHQMLFINDSAGTLRSALVNSVDQGLIRREQPKDAYCLTDRGYEVMRAK